MRRNLVILDSVIEKFEKQSMKQLPLKAGSANLLIAFANSKTQQRCTSTLILMGISSFERMRLSGIDKSLFEVHIFE